jgi:dipeptidyl aminopeptidase/acylaminoacyl peptidase
MRLNLYFRQFFRGSRIGIALALIGQYDATISAAQLTDPVIATQIVLQEAKSQAMKEPLAAFVKREDYVRRAEVIDVQLSPDGRRISYLRRGEKGIDVMLYDIASGGQTRVAAGLQRAHTRWSGDGRRLWIADEHGLAVIETSDLKPKRIFKWDSRRSQRLWAVDPRAPQYAVLHEKVIEPGTKQFRYLRVDARGDTHLLLEADWPLRSALLNAEGDLAFTAAFDGPGYETVVRQYSASKPRELLRSSSLEECRLIGYNQSEQMLWMLSRHEEDKLSLRCWREDSQRWETMHRDPVGVVDADDVFWSPSREKWLAIAYHGARRRWYGSDNGTRAILIALQEQLPGANLQLSTTMDERLWLVQAQKVDVARDRFYLYQPDQNQLEPLFASKGVTETMPAPGKAMYPVSYRASDGMLLHGYLALPSGVAPAKAPLIAWLHGGPITRIHDRYDAGIQLLVNRGYAVFAPNFRASSGYGLNYVLAANGDVGNGRVLADVIDGLDFLLAEGIGDRDRQAVMGISFGGYASLLAVSHHSARFRVAFAGAPPTEYGWTKQWQAEHDNDVVRPEGPPLSQVFPQLGFPYEDAAWREKMHRESPLAALPKLQTPIYIWAGARDDRVPLKSIVHYVGEAGQLDKKLSLLIDPEAGHIPKSPLGTEACLYMIELAAHRHLGGKLSSVSPELKAFLSRNVRMEMDLQRKP